MHYGTCEVILFRKWIAETIGAFIGSAFGLFFLALLHEGIRYYREHLDYSLVKNKFDIQQGEKPQIKTNMEYIFSKSHIIQSLLHPLQIAIGYWLMLIFMQFNFWLILSILLGATFGYLLCAWLRRF